MSKELKRIPIIAILGKANAGKDTVGDMLGSMAPCVRTSFASKLKQIVGEMFNFSEADLNDPGAKEAPTVFDCLRCPECKSLECTIIEMDRQKYGQCNLCGVIGDAMVFKSKWTRRAIMQHIGTEGFRRISKDVWVQYALTEAEKQFNAGRELGPEAPRLIVITDCRFRSEAERVWASGGQVWRVKRPSLVTKETRTHSSETEQDEIRDEECQAVIVNDGSLDVLRARVHVQLAAFLKSLA